MTETSASNQPKKSRFGVGLVIYAWVLLMIGGGLLFVLHNYLIAYEASQPKHCLAAYRDGLEQKLPDAAVEALAGLDPAIQSPEENERWALTLLQGASLVKDPARSGDDELVYYVKTADGTRVGTVTFAVTDKGRFGLPVWGPVEEAFDFSPYYRMVGLTVPPDYEVYLGSLRLGPAQVLDDAVPYDALAECYQHYENLPLLVRYEGGPFLGAPALRVCDQNGQEVPLEELTQERFLDRCSPEDREAVEEFIPRFLTNYIFYSADVNGTAMRYYGALNALVVPQSQLEVRLRQAIGSFGWSNTKALEILSMEVRCVTDLGEGRFLVDVGYETRITGLQGPVEVQDQAQVVLVYYNGSLRAEAIYHY